MARAFFLDYHVHAEWVMREGDIVRLAYSWRGQIFLSNREHFRHKSLTFSLLSAIMLEIHLRSCFAAVLESIDRLTGIHSRVWELGQPHVTRDGAHPTPD